MDEHNIVGIRSIRSTQRAFVLFVNTTARDVDCLWADYAGKATFYCTLAPNMSGPINTFTTHPWLFRDQNTGEHMHVEHKNIFLPKPYVVPTTPGAIRRNVVRIHFPVRTLQQNAIWAIVRNINRIEDINQLEVPNVLKSDLRHVFTIYNKQRRQVDNGE